SYFAIFKVAVAGSFADNRFAACSHGWEHPATCGRAWWRVGENRNRVAAHRGTTSISQDHIEQSATSRNQGDERATRLTARGLVLSLFVLFLWLFGFGQFYNITFQFVFIPRPFLRSVACRFGNYCAGNLVRGGCVVR